MPWTANPILALNPATEEPAERWEFVEYLSDNPEKRNDYEPTG